MKRMLYHCGHVSNANAKNGRVLYHVSLYFVSDAGHYLIVGHEEGTAPEFLRSTCDYREAVSMWLDEANVIP